MRVAEVVLEGFEDRVHRSIIDFAIDKLQASQ